MKKVIITTFFKSENYGAVLQAYSMQTVLKEKGYHVSFLNYRDLAIEDTYRIRFFKKDNPYWFLRNFFGTLLFYKKKKQRHLKFKQFLEERLHVGKPLYDSVETIVRNPPDADIYITGSDQVWNSAITKGLSDIYTLNFGKNHIRRIAYAASIGTGSLTFEEEKVLGEKLSVIDKISVREFTAKKLLSPCLPQKKICTVLDPVLLRNPFKWAAEISDIPREKEKYILAYLLQDNEECKKTVDALAEKTGLKIIHFGKRQLYQNPSVSAYKRSPFEFVSLIQHAEYIVTTSFHGMAFSILFHKKFFVFPPSDVGSRITDLLALLQIPERAFGSLKEFLSKGYTDEIDYQKVDMILEKERQKSLQWLSAALGEDNSIC